MSINQPLKVVNEEHQLVKKKKNMESIYLHKYIMYLLSP